MALQAKVLSHCFSKLYSMHICIVGKGGHTCHSSRSTPPPSPPFSKVYPILGIQDVSTFHRSIGKTKVLINYCKQFAYHFYPQSILILEENLQKR